VIPVFLKPPLRADRAKQIQCIHDAPVDTRPLHLLSAVITNAGPVKGFSCSLRSGHRLLPLFLSIPDLIRGISRAMSE
jgi:hypothetical protein